MKSLAEPSSWSLCVQKWRDYWSGTQCRPVKKGLEIFHFPPLKKRHQKYISWHFLTWKSIISLNMRIMLEQRSSFGYSFIFSITWNSIHCACFLYWVHLDTEPLALIIKNQYRHLNKYSSSINVYYIKNHSIINRKRDFPPTHQRTQHWHLGSSVTKAHAAGVWQSQLLMNIGRFFLT